MGIRIRKGAAVPIVISEKVVKNEPEAKRHTKFLGFRAGLSNLINTVKGKIAETIHQSFYHEYIDEVDMGVIEETHYVLQIGGTEHQPKLTVEKTPYKPPCAHHYEIITVSEEAEEADESEPEKPESDIQQGFTSARPIPQRIVR